MGSGGDNYTRRDGFNDTEPKVESYGSGAGSGAYDLANTGLGGYGNNKGGPTGHPTSSGFTSTGKSGVDIGEGSTERREGFGSGGGTGPSGGTYGAGASDPANTGLGGYSGDETTSESAASNPEENGYGTGDIGEQLQRAHEEGQRQ